MKKLDPILSNSIIVLIVIAIATFFFTYQYQLKFDALNSVIGALASLSLPIYIVILIDKVRHPSNVSIEIKRLGIWGYVWRTELVRYLSIIISAILYTSLTRAVAVPSAHFTFIIFLMSLFSALFLIWLFFSEDRKGQFHWLMRIFPRF